MAFVQTSGKLSDNNSTTSPKTFAMPSNFTAGNTAVVSLSYFQSSSNAVSAISLSGTAAARESQSTDGAGSYVEIWRVQSLAGGSNVISVTSSTSTHFLTLSVEEWSGVSAVAADIIATPATGSSTTPGNTYGTLAQANELVYLAYCDTTGTAQTSVTPPAGGYTQAWTELDGATNFGGGGAYKEVSSTAGASPAFTLSNSTGWRCVLVTFKLSGGTTFTSRLSLLGVG